MTTNTTPTPPITDTGWKEGDTLTGVVYSYDRVKGWGFIRPEGTGRDVFVHWRHCPPNGANFRELTPGQRVRFQIGQGQKGACAILVEVI